MSTAFEVGKQVVAESESTDPRPRRGVVEEGAERTRSPHYRIRCDDGHESIYTRRQAAPSAPNNVPSGDGKRQHQNRKGVQETAFGYAQNALALSYTRVSAQMHKRRTTPQQ